jgi:hypothetical protein
MTRKTSKILTRPGKMPGFSFSLPAGVTCPASKIANRLKGPLSICGACYAMSGNYTWPTVRNAQMRRLAWVRAGLANGHFVRDMIAELARCVDPTDPHFRVHDSGDLFSIPYAKAWVAICTALPWIKFWIPTREWVRPLMLPVLQELAALPNVTVRPSALGSEDPAPSIPGLSAGTTVHVEETAISCPATATAFKHCDDHGCRRCWSKVGAVSYVAHGRKAPGLNRAVRALPVAVRALPVIDNTRANNVFSAIPCGT